MEKISAGTKIRLVKDLDGKNPVGSTATVIAPARFHLDAGKLPSYTEGENTKIFLTSGKYVLQSK